MERDSRRHKRLVERLSDENGQSTVEFAVIASGFIALVVALGALWHAIGNGLIVEHALAAASHHLQGVPAPNMADILRY